MGLRRQLSTLQDYFSKSRREKAQLQEQVAALLGEREFLGRQNQLLGQERDDLEQRDLLLVQEKGELEKKVQLLVKEAEELKQRCRSTEQEKDNLIQHLERWRIAYTELEEKHDATQRESQHLAQLHAESEDKAHRLANKVSSLQEEFGEKEATLHAQLARAQAAGAYLSTADSVSHVELAEMVVKLNAQIFQLAALLEDVVEIQSTDVVGAETVERSFKSLEKWLESPMLDQLTKLQADEGFWVGMGLQAVMTQFAVWRINAWDFDATRDKGLRSTYEAVFKDGEHLVIKSQAYLTHHAPRASGNLRAMESLVKETRGEAQQDRREYTPSCRYPD